MTDIQTWVERYRQAWETADPSAAADLFRDDATYRSNIFEDPHVGRAGIEAYWSQATVTQRDIEVRMGRPIVDGDRVSVEFWTTMESEGADLTLPGCLLLTFDDEGKCRTLHEYYSFGEGRLDPPPEWGGHVA
ncbi:MAG: nuclear transport factor 2 family protein [Acidimicrobiia bacterium]